MHKVDSLPQLFTLLEYIVFSYKLLFLIQKEYYYLLFFNMNIIRLKKSHNNKQETLSIKLAIFMLLAINKELTK